MAIPPHCPKCRTKQLVERTLSDRQTRIDVCPDCRGGWFDSGELADILSVAVDSLAVPSEAECTSRVCPKCLIPMHQFEYPGSDVEVDVCAECHGIWLDRGEFRELNQDRGRYQDPHKFEPPDQPPKNMKEAAIQFVDRILVRFVNFEYRK